MQASMRTQFLPPEPRSPPTTRRPAMELDDVLPASRPKRKSMDDHCLPQGFPDCAPLSPRKKLRQEAELAAALQESEMLADRPLASPLVDLDLLDPVQEQQQPQLNSERALVLYNQGTPSFSPDACTSFRLDTSFITKQMLSTSNFGHFPGQLQMPRLPTPSSVVIEEIEDDSEAKVRQGGSMDKSLAMVPWVPNTPWPDATLLPVPEVEYRGFDHVFGDKGLVSEASDTEAMEEDSGPCLDGMDVSSQAMNSFSSFSGEPWQHYGVPQPLYGHVMSSY